MSGERGRRQGGNPIEGGNEEGNPREGGDPSETGYAPSGQYVL